MKYMPAPPAKFEVEVAYVGANGAQSLLTCELDSGSRVEDAVRASGLLDRHPEIDLDRDAMGLFGNRTTLETKLSAGDRVEVYRNLQVDPKQSRRERAKKSGRTRK